MTRADRIAAALEHWKKWAEYLRAFSGNTLGRAADAGDALAALLREPQPAPVVGDDDAALLAKTQDWLCHNLTVTPDSHYRNVQALLERCSAALADVARLTEENAALRSEVDAVGASYDRARLAAREARAAAEAAVAAAQRDDVLFTAFVFGFLRRDLEKRSCLPPPEWYSEDSMIVMILDAIRARAEKEESGA